jgi:hypothetical protein
MIGKMKAMRLAAFAGAIAAVLVACGASDGSGSDEGVGSTSQDLVHKKPPPPPPKDAGAKPCTPDAGDVQALIKAAQTPDGTAIGQPPGPNGVCAPVVAALGFWSCTHIGDTCHYQTCSVTHQCSCIRLDGEGGLPAWNCD